MAFREKSEVSQDMNKGDMVRKFGQKTTEYVLKRENIPLDYKKPIITFMADNITNMCFTKDDLDSESDLLPAQVG